MSRNDKRGGHLGANPGEPGVPKKEGVVPEIGSADGATARPAGNGGEFLGDVPAKAGTPVAGIEPRTMLVLAVLLSLAAGCAATLLWLVLVGAPFGIQTPPAAPGAPFRPVVDPVRSYGSLVLHYLRTSDPHQPAGAALFLGDSHTQGLAVAAVAPVAVNYGVGGLNTQGLLDALPFLEAPGKARVVVVMIGSNDLPTTDLRALGDRFEAIAAALPGPLVWHAIPVNQRVPPEQTAEANDLVRQVCAAHGRCQFVETAFEPADFQNDRSHLSPSGYRKWIATLRTALAP